SHNLTQESFPNKINTHQLDSGNHKKDSQTETGVAPAFQVASLVLR
ncbi:unnamed protein product, partial [Brassica rapa subsp. narinosa]